MATDNSDTVIGPDEFLDNILAQGSDSLKHYGVPGMKWGVRRSDRQLARASGKSDGKKTKITTSRSEKKKGKIQNVDLEREDGSTHKYVRNTKTNNVHQRSKESVSKEKTQAKLNEFGLEALSNKELQAYADRMNLEKRVRDLNPPVKNAGKEFAKKLLVDTAKGEVGKLIKEGQPGPILQIAGKTKAGKKFAAGPSGQKLGLLLIRQKKKG